MKSLVVWLLLCMVSTQASAGENRAVTDQKSTLAVTKECAAGSTVYTEVPLHTGVANERAVAVQPIAALKLPIGYEGGQYGDCLERHDVTRQVAKDPYFAHVKACREKVRNELKVTVVEPSSHTIQANLYARAVDECARSHGVPVAPNGAAPGRIEVEIPPQ